MDSSQDKQLPASERRLNKAREDGQVTRSRDLSHLAVLGIGGLAMMALAPHMFGQFKLYLGRQLSFDARTITQPTEMLQRLQDMVGIGLLGAAVFGLIVAAAAMLSTVAAGGWVASLKPVMPDFSRANPLTGFGRLFTKDRLSDVLKMVVLTVVLLALGTVYLSSSLGALAMLVLQPSTAALQYVADWLIRGMGLMLLVILLLALVDVPLQNFLHKSRLKMSHQEVKQEHKESDGNPQLKSKQRQRQREAAQGNSIAAVPKADFVLMNPSHFAVAIRYDEASMRAASGLQRRGPAGHADTRFGQAKRDSSAAVTHAGACPVCQCRAGPGYSGQPVHRCGSGDGLHLPAQGCAARRRADARGATAALCAARARSAVAGDCRQEPAMNPQLQALKNWFDSNKSLIQGAAAPILVVAILAMMVLPMPPWLLDTFFTLNIAVALMVMMVAAYMLRPLDFSAFPAILLLTTLMRLSLNVASTRVVLLEGHTGPGAAGAVIEAFGHFLIGGNFAVGLIVFSILVVINFVVVTKGAERIAEVSARFALDAMPGKQMAVDADLNAGLIDEKEAKRRRAEVSEEADFFGSMDGASKFVRGDAVAGILILLINIFGGFAIGVLQHGLSAGQAADTYILLAVGDALVAQVPGLLISVAAAMVVSRVGKEQDLGRQIVAQMLVSPKVLGITAGIMGVLGVIPGMPHVVFLGIALVLGYGAWSIAHQPAAPDPAALAAASGPAIGHGPEGDASWDDLQPVDQLGLELGYRLIAMVIRVARGIC